MKTFFKKIALLCGIIAVASATFSLTSSAPVSADNSPRDLSSCTYFLGMTNWDCNFDNGMNSEERLSANIITIATNILNDISVIASYLVIGYVIYGGYLYMFSSGDPGKAAAGKKTLTNAFIGLGITISAYTIFSAIRIAMIGNTNLGDCSVTNSCVGADDMIVNLIQWIAGMGGIVAAIFIVVGGWGYMTSAGDPNKLTKAKNTLLYAFIGLLIVALTEVITAFVASTFRDANSASSYTTSIIAENNNYKETIYEKNI